MQRWLVDTDDVVVRGRSMSPKQVTAAKAALAAEIDEILRNMSQTVQEKED